MWPMLPSLQVLVEEFKPVFTTPSFVTHCQLLLCWVMCLGPRHLMRVFLSSPRPDLHDYAQRHGLDSEYNFFERSAWTPSDLGIRLAVFVLTHMPCGGGVVELVIDDTLFHKRGLHVWGLGWFRDAVASTKKRVATASGHNWVVLAIVVQLPMLGIVLAQPIMARLHLPGKGNPSCAQLARQMLQELLDYFPTRRFSLLGDGGYTNVEMLGDLDERVQYTGRMRADAELYDPVVPQQRKGKRGVKPQKGPRLPNPRTVAKQAVPPGQSGTYQWQEMTVTMYGVEKTLWACGFKAVWPRVTGLTPIRVVIVRDPEGKLKDTYLMTTDLTASLEEVVKKYSRRWSIEVMFRACKQVMDIEAPQHYCQASVEKVVPWVLGLQTLVSVWYWVAGRELPQAEEVRAHMGEWDSEWSLANMVRVLRRATLNAGIEANSGGQAEMRDFLGRLLNWVHLAT
jgi:hypothetical protein